MNNRKKKNELGKKMETALKRYKRWGVAVSIILGVASGAALIFAAPFWGAQEYHVELREDGFYPEELSVQVGDTVTFSTSRGQLFWPASALHPDHSIYPEFDPQQPINPGNSWSFRFEKEGRWKYHDHLHPNYSGVITVGTSGSSIVALAQNCVEVSRDQKMACWDQQLEATLKAEGLDAAFDLFVHLYQTEPDIPKACHEWGHVLGEAAYDLYMSDEDFKLVPETAYCGYGFYHGFLEEFVRDTGGNFAEIQQFCTSVSEELGEQLFSVYRNCVHGVGHGTTAWILEDPSYWGDFQKVADAGLGVCEDTFGGTNEIRDCYDGVFNELYLDVLNSQYRFNFTQFKTMGDPFWYCRRVAERHKESCYFEFIGLTYTFFNYDVKAATRYFLDTVDNLEEYGDTTIGKLAADYMQFDIVKDSHEPNVEACRMVPGYLFQDCFFGITNGFIQHGEPENMHEKGLHFCGEGYLTAREKTLCYQNMFGLLRANYSTEKLRQVCSTVGAEVWRSYCPL